MGAYMQTVGKTAEWSTPQWLFDQLDAEFHFTLDPCSTDENAKCRKHYTAADDGLTQDWTGETVFCNPPYGRGLATWVQKCFLHASGGGVVVMLVPARTDAGWFHDYIYGYAEVRFIRGRLKYGGSKWKRAVSEYGCGVQRNGEERKACSERRNLNRLRA